MSLRDVKVHLVNSVDGAQELMRWLSTRDLIGVDTESSGLDKDRDRVRLVQVGDETTGWAIPWERWGGVFEELVGKYEGEYVAHNTTFDVAMLKNEGLELPTHRMHDTRLQTHCLSSLGSLALKKIAKALVDPNADAGQDQLADDMKRNGWNWANIPTSHEAYWVYGALDPVLTVRVHNVQYPRVKTECPGAYDLELAVAWVCERMERKGARIDRDYSAAFAAELAAYVDRVEAWVRETYGIYAGSNDPIIEILRRDGVNLVKRTPSGAKYSLDKEVLADLGHPLATAVLGRRQAQKMLSTYLTPYLRLSEGDGFIHPSINTVGGTDKNPFEPGGGRGVRTGRMSMSDPNLQNVPIRTGAGKRIRNCFVPREGNAWIKCDFSQIEMRIMAHVSRDPGLAAAFNSEGDFFVNLARDLFAEPNFQKSDPRRQMVKNGGYAKIYGSGVATFARTAGAPEAEAAAFMQRFDALYPCVPTLQRRIEREARERLAREGEAYVRSPLTGRKHVADDSRMYALLNYLIQGTAAELMKMKIVEADQAGLSDYLLFPVHDEIDLDVPNGEVEDVTRALGEIMNDDKILDIPVTSTLDVGDRWGSTEEVPWPHDTRTT